MFFVFFSEKRLVGVSLMYFFFFSFSSLSGDGDGGGGGAGLVGSGELTVTLRHLPLEGGNPVKTDNMAEDVAAGAADVVLWPLHAKLGKKNRRPCTAPHAFFKGDIITTMLQRC